jgi:hypothetical protein
MAGKTTERNPTLWDLVERALELAVSESKARGYQGRELRRIIFKLEACQQLLDQQDRSPGGLVTLVVEETAPPPLRKAYEEGDARGVLLQRIVTAQRAAVKLARATGWRLIGRVATKLAACEHVITDPECYRFDDEWESGKDVPSWNVYPLAARASEGSSRQPSLPSDRTDHSFPSGAREFARVHEAPEELKRESDRWYQLSDNDPEMDERDERARKRLAETYGSQDADTTGEHDA